MSARTAITIGTFDGVHRGHTELLRLAREAVGPNGRVVALVFDPHPLSKLAPHREPPRLSTWVQRSSWLTNAGADQVDRLEPTTDLLSRTAAQFTEQVSRDYGVDVWVEGNDFRFGAERGGDVATLRDHAASLGFELIVARDVQAALVNQIVVRVSSTRIRELVSLGRVADASLLLGRPYELIGTVVRGDQRGRTIGFPTANLETDQLLPGDGVYAGTAHVPDGPHAGQTFAAAIHIGPRLVFGDSRRVVEAHLINLDAPTPTEDADYGWPMHLSIERFLRDLAPFDSVQALVDQIGRDVARAKQLSLAPTEVPA